MENIEGTEEPLDGMGRGHWFLRHLHYGPVALVPLQLIEMTQVPPGAVEEKVQRL